MPSKLRKLSKLGKLTENSQASLLAESSDVSPAWRVLVAAPVDKAFDYLAPDDMALKPGSFVRVPFGPRRLYGVVQEPALGDEIFSRDRLKSVLETVDLPPISSVNIDFIQWVADYTLSSVGAVTKMMMPLDSALDPPLTRKKYKFCNVPSELRVTKARQAVLDFLKTQTEADSKTIQKQTGASAAVLSGLEKTGAIQAIYDTDDRSFAVTSFPPSPVAFTSAQQQAIEYIHTRLGADGLTDGFSATVIDGVTGSGKTEVYFEAILECLRKFPNNHGQVLVLLPEIALSNQWLERFKRRFGVTPAVWHSDLTPAQRRRTWRAIVKGQASVVVGARSALFLPFPNLRLIVVDEEHDHSYKQEEGVIYQARDMAVMRAHLGKIPILLASATPSMETLNNIESGKYQTVSLPARATGATMPEMSLIDLREEQMPPQSWISPQLKDLITANLQDKKQTLLYLNRRGYAPLLLCRECGHRLECPQCTAWMVEHKLYNNLMCHQCGYQMDLPKKCNKCGAEDSFSPIGPGVERLLEEAKGYFPQARIEVMSSDTLSTPKQVDAMLSKILSHKIDILVGTQIVAKGHHFPLLTLVGVVDADLGLSGGDLRASERVFQLLHQVAGRAGREDHTGHVYLQTYMPDHPVMQAIKAGDRDAFMTEDAQARKLLNMPPYGKLAAFIVSALVEEKAAKFAKDLARTAPRHDQIQVFGPAPAPFARLRGKYRFRLLIKAHKNINLQKVVRDWIEPLKIPAKVKLQIDIDPYSFF